MSGMYPRSANDLLGVTVARDKEYWERVAKRAEELESDGCTSVPDFYLPCCQEHDIAWRTGATVDGEPQSTPQANTRFRHCIQEHSRLGVCSPMAWWRYWGVCIGALFIAHKGK